MEQKLIKMPSIEQFRSVVHNIEHAARYIGFNEETQEPIYDRNAELPKVTFTGTVKVHGTNASFCMNSESHWFQSKSNILSIEKDNAAFCYFGEARINSFKIIAVELASKNGLNLNENTITLYGEFSGGNIQKGVAVNGLEKMFILFGAKITPHNEGLPAYWLYIGNKNMKNETYYSDHKNNIFNSFDFPVFSLEIDFENPHEAQNRLSELTIAVEEKCPVGVQFGVEGIGEGIVWEAQYKDVTYRFKVKGEKHSSSKVKTLAAVDIEKVANIKEFIDYVVTENRLNQGIEQVFAGGEAVQEKTGEFVQWVKNDVFKEEMDTLVKSGLEPKEVSGPISKKCAKWFMEFLNNQAGL